MLKPVQDAWVEILKKQKRNTIDMCCVFFGGGDAEEIEWLGDVADRTTLRAVGDVASIALWK